MPHFDTKFELNKYPEKLRKVTKLFGARVYKVGDKCSMETHLGIG